MISPSQARRLIDKHSAPLASTAVALERALGLILAADVRTPHPLPHFDNSAMDGYALRSADTAAATSVRRVALALRTPVHAGDTKRRSLRTREACAIMTGAPLPRGADTIVPLEEALVDGQRLVITGPVARGRHVRRRGEEVARGAMLAQRGNVVHPGVVGCIAAAGLARVRVVPRPVVSVIATGNETQPPGARLAHGQIYDSNSHMIAAALRQAGIEKIFRQRVKDRRASLDAAIATALSRSDAVVVIGGVSVGERDLVRPVLQANRVTQVFWRVSQKPGKPLYFGKRGKKLVFGLPGNPASAFTCFYLYVYPALLRLAGHRAPGLAVADEKVAGKIVADAKRWRFLKGRSKGEKVVPAGGQGSHMIAALAEADRLIAVPPFGTVADATSLRLPYAEEDE